MTTTIHHEGLRAPGSGPNDPESVTRKKMQFWDRSKFLIALVLAYLVLTWKVMADHEGIMSFPEGARQIAMEYQWIFWLLGVEITRQLHFFVSEHWSGYHRFWSQKVFGGFERWTHRRFDDWTRFRLARALKILFFVTLIALVLGAVLDVSPFTALLQAPALIWQALPFFLQIVFLFFFVIIQFVGLFWFLSRAASRRTSPMTSRPASTTCGDRTTWSSASRRTSSSWSGPTRSRGAAVTSPAACCCGARRAPARP
ncbi:hypothetical protein ACFQ0B_30435 [Nonomuraea thailandensis]